MSCKERQQTASQQQSQKSQEQNTQAAEGEMVSGAAKPNRVKKQLRTFLSVQAEILGKEICLSCNLFIIPLEAGLLSHSSCSLSC